MHQLNNLIFIWCVQEINQNIFKRLQTNASEINKINTTKQNNATVKHNCPKLNIEL